MSIKSTVGNIARDVTEGVSSRVSSASTKVNSLLGSATTFTSNVFEGGFVGISTKNADSLKTAINNYIQGIQDIIDGFDENANLENAYKGKIQTETQEFIRAVKELLQAYITQMRVNLSEFEAVIENYTSSDQDLGSQVSSQANDIRQNAASIRID